jgi:transposase
VLGAVRELNRLEFVGEPLRQALEVLVDVVPAWLRTWWPPEWAVRYAQPMDAFRLPKDRHAREQLGQVIGVDGDGLLGHGYADRAPRWLREVPAIETLRRVWVQQYEVRDDQVFWRAERDLPPPQELIGSPFDPDARTSTKRDLTWNGYQVHLTETCEPDAPQLVTNVVTTSATVPDVSVTAQVHDALAAKDLCPSVHVVDEGYPDAAELAHAASTPPSRCWGRCAPAPVGKRKRPKAMPWRRSPSIGRRNRSPARRVSSVTRGRLSAITAPIRASR